jgi:hypothetical protein
MVSQPEFQTEKAGSVYREDRYECYRVGTELTWEDVVAKKHQEEIIHGKLL